MHGSRPECQWARPADMCRTTSLGPTKAWRFDLQAPKAAPVRLIVSSDTSDHNVI